MLTEFGPYHHQRDVGNPTMNDSIFHWIRGPKVRASVRASGGPPQSRLSMFCRASPFMLNALF
jgi:hypothetical protein